MSEYSEVFVSIYFTDDLCFVGHIYLCFGHTADMPSYEAAIIFKALQRVSSEALCFPNIAHGQFRHALFMLQCLVYADLAKWLSAKCVTIALLSFLLYAMF